MSRPPYAELQVTSNFSFLRGGSHPRELVSTAAQLGLSAIGLADRNTLAGVVQAYEAAKEARFRFLVGCRLDFSDGSLSTICYPTDRGAYGRLARLLTQGQRRAIKGQCELVYDDLLEESEGQILIALPNARIDADFERRLRRFGEDFPGAYLAASRLYGAQDAKRLSRLALCARQVGLKLIATGDALYHHPHRRALQDVLTCIREKCTITEAGFRLEANAERHLKSPAEMARLFAAHPDAVSRTQEIVERCRFSLGDLSYEYPDEPVPPGKTPQQHLEDLTWEGARRRYPDGVPEEVRQTLRKELALISERNLPQYFLTVHDIVQYARGEGILCQGRGSAANSAVCFCLGVTAVDPTETRLLFERFISKERNEPPDIDVDFEHERREEVIQYIYQRYGRDRAAICATVIHYRPRSAIRDVGKALGLTEDVTAALANTVWGSWGSGVPDEHVRQAGLDPQNQEVRRAVDLATELLDFPRHLSQHVGGFVLTRHKLDETVPIGNAAMPDRTFIEWDKDDIDALGLMKVDVLALGMLTCLRKSLEFLRAHHGLSFKDLADIPTQDDAVYNMLSKGDSIGVFQVESRAQMSMLPRLKPKNFYDLVIEVAIVRPGPIQGDMVHPYLRRRDGLEPVVYPSPANGSPDEMKEILGRTLGVPLFQEQAMSIAIEAAGFSPEEANGLRRAMATFRNVGTIHNYRDMFISRMVTHGYEKDFAERCFKQIEGFGSYGFPESHAASFAKLVYASAWIKHHYPDAFCAAILNSQPMGFYAPAQLVRDAREHGVEVRAPDALISDWDCTLEPTEAPSDRVRSEGASGNRSGERLHAVRLGLRMVQGLSEVEARKLIAARNAGARRVEEIARKAGLAHGVLERIAGADAFRSADLDRREALWRVSGLDDARTVDSEAPLLAELDLETREIAALPPMPLSEHVVEDYRTIHLSLKAHPCVFFRKSLSRKGVVRAADLHEERLVAGQRIRVAGLVLNRQRPGTAKGVLFGTLEDETGPANIIVWPDLFEAQRRILMTSSFLLVEGRLQKASGVVHVVAERVYDLSGDLSRLCHEEPGNEETGKPPPKRARLQSSRDFH